MREQVRGVQTVLRAALAADRRLTWSVLALGSISGGIWIGRMLVVREMVERVTAGEPGTLVPLALVLGALMAAAPIWWRGVSTLSTTLHERTSGEFERRLIASSASAPGLQQHESSEYLDELTLVRAQMRDLGNPAAVSDLLSGLSLLGVSVALLATVHPACALLPVFALPSAMLATRVERARASAEREVVTAQRLRQRLFGLLADPATAKEVKVLGLGSELRDRHRAAWAASIGAGDRSDVAGALRLALGWGAFTLGLTGVLWLLVWRTSLGEVSAGDMMLFVLISQALTGQIADLLASFVAMQRMVSAANRYRGLEALADRTNASRPSGKLAAVPERIATGISLEGIGFAYPGRARPVLSDVSLVLPAGATVALVGENGAGKSTLVKLLCRLYEPTEGRIALDGVDIAAFDVAEWRARLAAGFQDFVRFELVAREAVGVGDLTTIDDVAAVRRALARAGDETVERRLPHGLETQLGESWPGGVDLSGGQWQRLAIGRAFMRAVPLLLVLDEPTASLDAAAEHRLFARFAAAARASAKRGAITLFVSHRFSTVQEADLIVVVHDGGIVETGTHLALMRMGGLYAELYELQARAYRSSRA